MINEHTLLLVGKLLIAEDIAQHASHMALLRDTSDKFREAARLIREGMNALQEEHSITDEA